MESIYHAAKAIMRNFDRPEQVLENCGTGTEVLHGFMRRQSSFAAGITDKFKEMRL